ncbi:MAG: lipid-A-disaccharide synthase [Hyphomicrobiaceae bacterium]
MGRRILMVAGEASGDAQGARLAAALLERDPTLHLYGMGGPLMREAGVDTVVDASELSMMGISEVVSGLRRAFRILARLRADFRNADRPDLVIPIDLPDFNLRLAKAAYRAGIPVFYYVAPQVWAWRRGRMDKICRWVDRLVVLFPFELDLWRERGMDAHFVGHPLAEDVVCTRSGRDTRDRYGLETGRALLVLLPGSRRKEIEAMLTPMLEAAAIVSDRVQVAVAKAPGLGDGLVEERVAASGVAAEIVSGDTYNLVASSDVALVTSGTATVECALLGCPTVVGYRMSGLTWAIARRLVDVSHIAMPNLVLQRTVMPELVQDEATPARMAAEVARFLDDASYRRATIESLAGVREQLVRPGAALRAADLALGMLS